MVKIKKYTVVRRIVIFSVTLILMLASILFNNPVRVTAQNDIDPQPRGGVEADARDFCGSDPDLVASAKYCVSGYMAGYYEEESKADACPEEAGAFISEPCQAGYDAGVSAAKADKKDGNKKHAGTTRDCSSFTGKDLENCEGANDRAGVGRDDGSAKTNDIDCKEGGMMGWILCPVFELGANVTSDAFENIIKPMLENVPVTTNSKDPFYKAWSNFRLLGNIVLVGAMLVLVYAQARGGGR